MDTKITLLIAGSILVLGILFGITLFDRHTTTDTKSNNNTTTPPPSTTGIAPPKSPTHSSENFPVSREESTKIVSARIDTVDTNNLSLGTPSYAYITLTNTGEVPIVKERIEITAGKDFGFLIGYQSRRFIHDYHQEIAPGGSKDP